MRVLTIAAILCLLGVTDPVREQNRQGVTDPVREQNRQDAQKNVIYAFPGEDVDMYFRKRRLYGWHSIYMIPTNPENKRALQLIHKGQIVGTTESVRDNIDPHFVGRIEVLFNSSEFIGIRVKNVSSSDNGEYKVNPLENGYTLKVNATLYNEMMKSGDRHDTDGSDDKEMTTTLDTAEKKSKDGHDGAGDDDRSDRKTNPDQKLYAKLDTLFAVIVTGIIIFISISIYHTLLVKQIHSKVNQLNKNHLGDNNYRSSDNRGNHSAYFNNINSSADECRINLRDEDGAPINELDSMNGREQPE